MDFDANVVNIISLVVGLIGMPVIQAIKQWAKVDGKTALAIASVLSIVLGFGSAYAAGALVGADLTLEAVINAVGVVFAAATIFYKALQADK